MKKITYLFIFLFLFIINASLVNAEENIYDIVCMYEFDENKTALVYSHMSENAMVAIDEEITIDGRTYIKRHEHKKFSAPPVNGYQITYDSLPAYGVEQIINEETLECLEHIYVNERTYDNNNIMTFNIEKTDDYRELKLIEKTTFADYDVFAYSMDNPVVVNDYKSTGELKVCSYMFSIPLESEGTKYNASVDLEYYFRNSFDQTTVGASTYTIGSLTNGNSTAIVIKPTNVIPYNIKLNYNSNIGCPEEPVLYLNDELNTMYIVDETDENLTTEEKEWLNSFEYRTDGFLFVENGDITDEGDAFIDGDEFDYEFDPLYNLGNRDSCSNILGLADDAAYPAYWLQLILNIMKYIAIIALIALSTMDFIKAITSQDGDALTKAIKTAGLRIIYCVLIFVFPIILEFLFETLGIYADPADPYCGLKP